MPKTDQYSHGGGGGEFDDEPPLLEDIISIKSQRRSRSEFVNDTDMAGPLVFCLAFGAFLLLSGKVHFSYIYGIGGIGCLGMYSLLNLMSQRGATLMGVASVLGYCLLPMVLLSGVNVIASL
ncbi:protein YIPF5-like, partial [Ctenocephalides felis]|uniref:protein YIPF5-like n=1 Tax=Ctenocephalides felis TaxID=7515 RepID=UPI000E6E167D